jgi:gamma-glutamyl phosphate reductase
MLPIILNNIFTRNRKDMAAAEQARSKARMLQRLTPRANESEAQAQAKPAEPKPEKG